MILQNSIFHISLTKSCLSSKHHIPSAAMQTAYVRNLNEKISLKKLKAGLMSFFGEHGYPVEEVQAWRKIPLRGQAFVVFKETVDIDQIADELNTEFLFDKPIHIQPARAESDLAVSKTQNGEGYEKYIIEARRKRQSLKEKQKLSVVSNKRKLESESETSQPKKPRHVETAPNKTMILTDLPPTCKQSDVDDLFAKFKGFLSATHVAPRKLALVEFQAESDAVNCYKSLGATPEVGGKKCTLSYAKK